MTTATLPDLYTALGVPRDASEMEIRGAYGRVVLAARESAHAAPSRELLDFALSTLTDPELRARYDAQAPVQAAATDPMADGAYVAEAAFQHARNGALWFAGGGLVTVLSYIGSGTGGKYFIAWGAVLFGAYQLLRGLFVYLGAPAAARTGRQMAVLGVLVAVGALSSGWVIANETGVVQDPTTAAWGAAIDKAEPIANKAADLFRQVSDRPGAWSTQVHRHAAGLAAVRAGRGAPQRGAGRREPHLVSGRPCVELSRGGRGHGCVRGAHDAVESDGVRSA